MPVVIYEEQANMSKKQCINDPSYTYTGKESSPLGLGYSASVENVGTVKEGRDKTHWMVGMKNGVKVWNRVPSEIASKKLEKEEPIMTGEETPAVIEPTVESVDAPAKSPKKTTKKAEPKAEPAAETAEPEKKAPAKKRAPAKKKVEEPTDEASESSSTTSEKKTRKPTAFNIFMKYRMKTMTEENPGMNHKDKFANTAREWKGMSDEQKAAIVAKAKEELGA